MNWLIRAARWARNPPSGRQVRLVLIVVALCATIVTIEWLGLWPDWAQAHRVRPRIPHP